MVERIFPVRLRVFVPEHGFGRRLDAMAAWLDARCGREKYWIGAQSGASLRDAILVYFAEVAPAQDFVARFDLAPLVEWQPPWPGGSPVPPTARADAGPPPDEPASE